MYQKIVLITGCSSGFGKAICQMFPKDQYYVVATARNTEALKTLQADLKLKLDVCNPDEVNGVVEKICEQTGRIDILINNAGFSVRAAVEEIDLAKMHDMEEVNVFGMIRMMQAVIPVMRAQKRGKILNIGSISGRMTGIINGGYCSTKYAVEAISEAARYELAGFGIEVTVIEPGAMDTVFFDRLAKNSETTMENKQSVYQELYARDLAFRNKQIRKNPFTCAQTVVKIIGKRKLKTRYTVGVSWIYRIFTHLPDGLKEIAIKRFN